MRRASPGFFAVLCQLAIACGESGEATALSAQAAAGGARANQTPAAPAPAAKAGEPLRLVPLEIHDPGIGTRAFTMLVPSGWKHEGGVHWQHQFSNLASGDLKVKDPRSKAALEIVPIVPACWDESGTLGFTPGTNYMGNVVARPPRDAADYVAQYFVPMLRQDRKNLKISGSKALPEVARLVEKNVQEPSMRKTVSAARVRLEYEDGGTPMAEDVYVTMVASRSALIPNYVLWSLEHQYAFRAERDKLDALEPLLQAMVASVRMDLEWYAGYVQVVRLQQQGQMQSIRDAGEISRRISRNNDEMLASMRSSWEERQRSQDRVSQSFSEAIRGVETYEHPFESRPVELPSGYDDAWVNVRGEYVLSNTAGYDPNVGDTVEWRRLSPK